MLQRDDIKCSVSTRPSMNGTVGRLWKVSAIYDNCSIMRISDMTKFWKRRCWIWSGSRCTEEMDPGV